MTRLKIAILILVCLFALTACSSGAPEASTGAGDSTTGTGDVTTDTGDVTTGTDVTESGELPNMDIDNSETGIGVIYQEYEGNDVVEILQISYDGQQPAFEEYNWRNPEIELINNTIAAGPLKIYQDFRDELLEDEYAQSIDIRSYAFDKDDLVQIVTTCIVFPETRPDLYTKLWSYNYSKADNRWLQLDDMLKDYNLTKADIEQKVTAMYTPSYDETIISVETAGFLINRMPAKPVTHFLLEVTLEFDSDPVVSFFMYTPELDELVELDPTHMFDPEEYGMAELDPPLLYAGGNDNDNDNDSGALHLTIDTDGITAVDESTYTLDYMAFVELSSYPPASDGPAYTEETLAARIKYLEGDAISISAIAPYEGLSADFSYPVWRIDYISGSNEDTTICADLIISTDTGEHRVHTSIAGDWEEDYHDEIERILASVELVS